MQSIAVIRSLLESRGLRPKHRLGQNFLHDHNHLRNLVARAGVESGDVVLEVGPGTGTLTEALLEAGAEVIAGELDPDMAAILRERIGDDIALIEADALDRGRTLNPAILDALAGRPFKLVANLPYQAASPLMSCLVIDHAPDGVGGAARGGACLGQWVTIQKEVADRLVAPPGNKTYGPLGIIIQALAEVDRFAVVPPACFWPQPKVTSAMVEILPRSLDPAPATDGDSAATILATADERRAFARFITDLFSKRRKQLGAVFGRTRPFPDGVDPADRPERLAVTQLVELFAWSQEDESSDDRSD
jgi:16S rRNA (adenine1518-N6/adenine1519-N6)-dimethyltransferase